jgi:hypothetical protein
VLVIDIKCVTGEVSKPAKPAPKPVSTPLAPKTTTTPTMGMISKQMPVKSFAVRESPGLRTMSTDPAELLLSLSADTGRHAKTGFQGQPAKVPAATAKKVITSYRTDYKTNLCHCGLLLSVGP